MKEHSDLSQEKVRELLDYDPDTGIFRWRPRSGRANGFNARCAGKVAGTDWQGYIQISLMNRLYKAHRLAFLWMTGSIPELVDHKNCIRSDNSWDNLREATYTLNFANSPLRRSNTSGFKGVTWCAPAQQWRAKIHRDGMTFHLGLFNTKEEAAAAYAVAADRLFGEFARTA